LGLAIAVVRVVEECLGTVVVLLNLMLVEQVQVVKEIMAELQITLETAAVVVARALQEQMVVLVTLLVEMD
jgi:hypothetical protein